MPMMRDPELVLAERHAAVAESVIETQEGLARARNGLEFLIAATPTGPMRNHLTDANIHIGLALHSLQIWKKGYDQEAAGSSQASGA